LYNTELNRINTKTPGPAKYDDANYMNNKKKVPVYRIGKAVRSMSPKNRSPGPGKYELRDFKNAPLPKLK